MDESVPDHQRDRSARRQCVCYHDEAAFELARPRGGRAGLVVFECEICEPVQTHTSACLPAHLSARSTGKPLQPTPQPSSTLPCISWRKRSPAGEPPQQRFSVRHEWCRRWCTLLGCSLPSGAPWWIRRGRRDPLNHSHA